MGGSQGNIQIYLQSKIEKRDAGLIGLPKPQTDGREFIYSHCKYNITKNRIKIRHLNFRWTPKKLFMTGQVVKNLWRLEIVSIRDN